MACIQFILVYMSPESHSELFQVNFLRSGHLRSRKGQIGIFDELLARKMSYAVM